MTSAIAKARRAAGATQDQAAALINKTQSHYAKIERGAVSMKAIDALILCSAWNVTLSQLLTGK